MMFAEEAGKMWSKQEEVWASEEKARKKLMQDVADSWKEEYEGRRRAARLVEDQEMIRMKEIEADIRDLNQHILEQESLQKDRRESLVEALDQQVEDNRRKSSRSYQEQQAEMMKQRQEEIREENKMARNLANLSLLSGKDGGVSDFRRRKVRWHF